MCLTPRNWILVYLILLLTLRRWSFLFALKIRSSFSNLANLKKRSNISLLKSAVFVLPNPISSKGNTDTKSIKNHDLRYALMINLFEKTIRPESASLKGVLIWIVMSYPKHTSTIRLIKKSKSTVLPWGINLEDSINYRVEIWKKNCNKQLGYLRSLEGSDRSGKE